jgi:ferrochelatase
MTIDALLLFSFGGPNGPEDVMPFLRNVTKGRNVPDERLALVAKQYELFGGRSPINDQNRALIAAVEAHMQTEGIDLPVYFGNRNWEPFLADTVDQMKREGIGHALVFATSAFGSYSGCRQYRENLAAASEQVEDGPVLQKLRLFYNHPLFIEAVADRIEEVYQPGLRLVFTAHSIPNSMASGSDYEVQLKETASLVVERLGHTGDWDLVYQSRSGPPHVPWLEPDICDHLASLKSGGLNQTVCVVPLGFVSDHTEVLYDLDHQAADAAAELGIEMVRAPTVGTHPKFVQMVVALIKEQTNAAPRLFLGNSGVWPDECPVGHCVPTQPSGRPG